MLIHLAQKQLSILINTAMGLYVVILKVLCYAYVVLLFQCFNVLATERTISDEF